jgi:hypothetical protein
VEVRHLRVPAGFAEPSAMLALKEGFHFCLSLALGRLFHAAQPALPDGALSPLKFHRAQCPVPLRRVPNQWLHVKQISMIGLRFFIRDCVTEVRR